MNEADKKPAPGRSEGRSPMMESDRTRNTPSTDMQADDAGTANSGNTGSATTNPSESVMKQEHKTEHEKGSRR